MLSLKNSSFLLSLCFFVSACQSTKAFNIKTFHEVNQDSTHDLHIIQVGSSRVQQKCLFFDAEAENKWRHQYFMYILNDKNEALEIMQPTNQDKASCYSQIYKIERVLQSEQRVTLCVRDELKRNIQDLKDQDELIQFGSLGNHKIAYEALTLDSVCNSKECFSNNDIWVNTCPGFVKQ